MCPGGREVNAVHLAVVRGKEGRLHYRDQGKVGHRQTLKVEEVLLTLLFINYAGIAINDGVNGRIALGECVVVRHPFLLGA